MSLARLSSRYSKSLLQLAVEHKRLEEVHQDMILIHKVCSSSRDFVLMLKSPIIKPDKKQMILEKIFSGKLSDLTFRFLNILLRKRREAYLANVAESFLLQYDAHQGISRASITTAVKIDIALSSKIQNLLKQSTKSENIKLETLVDESILAGFVLRFEDKLYDASAATQLETLGKEFSKNTYTKKY